RQSPPPVAPAHQTPRLSQSPAPLRRTDAVSDAENAKMPERVYNVLFLCTATAARSVVAESILNSIGAGRFKAFSAGSHPTGKVNPLALELLRSTRMPTEGLASKSWERVGGSGAAALALR